MAARFLFGKRPKSCWMWGQLRTQVARAFRRAGGRETARGRAALHRATHFSDNMLYYQIADWKKSKQIKNNGLEDGLQGGCMSLAGELWT